VKFNRADFPFDLSHFQVSSNLVAFEDANIKETCEVHDFWDMADRFDYHDTLGDVLSAGADFPRTT
jgi:hypothetical protein